MVGFFLHCVPIGSINILVIETCYIYKEIKQNIGNLILFDLLEFPENIILDVFSSEATQYLILRIRQ